MKKYLILACTCLLSIEVLSQNDTTKSDKGVFFANINAFFSNDINNNSNPKALFGVSSSILGYKKSFSNKVNATIMYDVTRTTNFVFPDSIGISSYFEGSKYTAYLKMAEIGWQITPWAEFCFGQLLNEQFLTVQDKFWGLRYINTTMQEYFRFGNPADFGARIKFKPLNNLSLNFSVVNGEGPFRYQDPNSLFQYSLNIEYKYNKNLIFKVYGDLQPPAPNLSKNRSAISLFGCYKNEKWTIGTEYDIVLNNQFTGNSDLKAISLFSSYKALNKTTIFARADYFLQYAHVKNESFVLAGIEYRPVSSLGLAVSVKRNTWLNTFIPGFHLGMRF